jgi:hypothetical protein
MSAQEQRETLRTGALGLLASIACSIVTGAAYTLVAPALAPYAPVALSGWWFATITFACVALLSFGFGHDRPRVVIVAAFAVSVLGAGLFALMLALPAFTSYGGNVIGLVNYALTYSAFAFFTILVIAFPAAIAGLVGSYYWHER